MSADDIAEQIDTLAVYQTIAAAAEPQLQSSYEGRSLRAMGPEVEALVRALLDKVARNAAGAVAWEIAEQLGAK